MKLNSGLQFLGIVKYLSLILNIGKLSLQNTRQYALRHRSGEIFGKRGLFYHYVFYFVLFTVSKENSASREHAYRFTTIIR